MPPVRVALAILLTLAAVLAAGAGPARAGTLNVQRDDVRNAVSSSSSFTNTLAQVAGMTIAPEISSATFKIEFAGQDDVDLSTTKIPIRHYFRSQARAWAPFLQVSAGYLSASKTLRERDEDGLILADRQHQGFSGLLLAGLRLPLAPGIDFSPTAGVGLTRLKNQTEPLNDYTRNVIMPLYRGIVGDYTIDALVLSAGMEMNLRRSLGPVNLELALRYSHFYLQTTSVTDSALEFSQNADVSAARLTAGGALAGLNLWGRPLIWQVFGGNVTWWGPDAESLGFSHYWEAGATIGLDLRGAGLMIDALRLGGSLISGDGVTGWSLILGYGI